MATLLNEKSYRYSVITYSPKPYSSSSSSYHKTGQEIQQRPLLKVTEFSFNELEWNSFYVFLTEQLVVDMKDILYNTCNVRHFFCDDPLSQKKRRELLEHYAFPISTWTDILVYFFIQVSPKCSGSTKETDVSQIYQDHMTFLQEACEYRNMAAFLSGMKSLLSFKWETRVVRKELEDMTNKLFKDVMNYWKVLFMYSEQNYSILIEFLSFMIEMVSINDMDDLDMEGPAKIIYDVLLSKKGNVNTAVESLRKKMEEEEKEKKEKENDEEMAITSLSQK